MQGRLVPRFVLGLLPSSAASAWADHMKECIDLSALLTCRPSTAAISATPARARPFPDVTAGVTVEECQKGNIAAGIPVLEKKLRDGRFTLPKRN